MQASQGTPLAISGHQKRARSLLRPWKYANSDFHGLERSCNFGIRWPTPVFRVLASAKVQEPDNTLPLFENLLLHGSRFSTFNPLTREQDPYGFVINPSRLARRLARSS